MNTTKFHLVKGLVAGAIAVVLFVVSITILGELLPPLKNLLKDAHHHHWVGKGVWSAVVFAVVTLGSFSVLRGKSENTLVASKLILYLSHALIAGTVLLFLFFVYEFYTHA